MAPRVVRCVALAALFAAAGSSYADGGEAGPTITEARRYYVLDATQLAALRLQLAEKALAAGLVRGAIGRARQDVEVRYRLDPGPVGCRLSELAVRVDVTLDLPAWQPEAKTRRPLRARWARMIAALTFHEEGHRDNAVWAANQLHAGLAALGPAVDCDAMGKQAQRAMFRVKLRFQLREQAYDRRTGHGVSQGSVL